MSLHDLPPFQDCLKIIAIGDPHLPGRMIEQKRNVINWVNEQPAVDLVVSLGDVCSTFGTESEYAFAADFFSRLKAPFITLLGNHDNFYSDHGFIRASKAERLIKIDRFRRAFPAQQLYFVKELNKIRLFFLALDGIESDYYSAISATQTDWFEAELAKFPHKTTIVFCHAPLWSEEVLQYFPPAINYIVQPAGRFKQIVTANRQIKLWLSGHVHFGMIAELLRHPFNNYANQVYNLLNCDMDGFSVLDSSIRPVIHHQIWSRTLLINENEFVSTIFNHGLGRVEEELSISAQFNKSFPEGL